VPVLSGSPGPVEVSPFSSSLPVGSSPVVEIPGGPAVVPASPASPVSVPPVVVNGSPVEVPSSSPVVVSGSRQVSRTSTLAVVRVIPLAGMRARIWTLCRPSASRPQRRPG